MQNVNNRLGVAYNLFTGIELLRHSVDCIRNNVDYICVVYSLTSHRGEALDYSFMDELERLLKEKKIDEIIEYKPFDRLGAKDNEANQRNLGLEKCKENLCTYFMTMDVDEMYLADEFKEAKDKIISGSYDSSACQMLSYYKYGNVIVDPPETYYVPFIYKINNIDKFIEKAFPVIVDGTRKYTVGKNYLFKRNELQMHHFTYVRRSIREKLKHSCTFTDSEKIENIEKHYNSFNRFDAYSKILTFHGYSSFKKINSRFNIKLKYE